MLAAKHNMHDILSSFVIENTRIQQLHDYTTQDFDALMHEPRV